MPQFLSNVKHKNIYHYIIKAYWYTWIYLFVCFAIDTQK